MTTIVDNEHGWGIEDSHAPACFRCGQDWTPLQWFDGPGAGERRRAICGPCEHRDWKLTIQSLAAPQG